MTLTKAYIGLGGNIGSVFETMAKAIKAIEDCDEVLSVRTSRYYVTTPVSSLHQDNYINAACEVVTSLTIDSFFSLLEATEKKCGKVAKPKDAPRFIDIDLLFFGEHVFSDEKLQVPHPRWNQRLFVMIPLLDLTEEVPCSGESFNLREYVKTFPNTNLETVVLL